MEGTAPGAAEPDGGRIVGHAGHPDELVGRQMPLILAAEIHRRERVEIGNQRPCLVHDDPALILIHGVGDAPPVAPLLCPLHQLQHEPFPLAPAHHVGVTGALLRIEGRVDAAPDGDPAERPDVLQHLDRLVRGPRKTAQTDHVRVRHQIPGGIERRPGVGRLPGLHKNHPRLVPRRLQDRRDTPNPEGLHIIIHADQSNLHTGMSPRKGLCDTTTRAHLPSARSACDSKHKCPLYTCAETPEHTCCSFLLDNTRQSPPSNRGFPRFENSRFLRRSVRSLGTVRRCSVVVPRLGRVWSHGFAGCPWPYRSVSS